MSMGEEQQFNGLLDVYKKTFATDGIAGLYRGFFGHFCACNWQILKVTPIGFRNATSFLQLRMMKFSKFFQIFPNFSIL